MASRLIRRIAIALLAFYAFGQASVALAACGMDRGGMAQAMAMPDGDGCDGCAMSDPRSVNALCVAHCTADLQLIAAAPDALPAPAIVDSLAIALPRPRNPPVVAYLPPGAPPRRILLHSFQV